MGLGAAMTFPATLALISNVFTERGERARAIGLWGAIAGVAIAMGPIVGGWLLEQFSWASIFIAMAPVAAVAAILVALIVPTSKDPEAAAPDIAGLALSSATMALLVFTIIEAPTYGVGSGPKPGRVCRLSGPARRVHRGRAARRASDARCAAVSQQAVQRGQRRCHRVVLHPVRLHLPDNPVLPVRPGLRPAWLPVCACCRLHSR